MAEIRNLNELAEYAYEQVQRINRMQRELADAAGEGESPRGYVRARTGPGGRLLELRIDPYANRLPSEELAEEVTAAISEAQQEYAQRADAIIAPVLDVRPSEQAADALEHGMGRLDELAADLEALAQRKRLTG